MRRKRTLPPTVALFNPVLLDLREKRLSAHLEADGGFAFVVLPAFQWVAPIVALGCPRFHPPTLSSPARGEESVGHQSRRVR